MNEINIEVEAVHAKRKRMNELYAEYSKASNGNLTALNREIVLKEIEKELLPLEEIFYPEPVQTIASSYFERLTQNRR